MRELRFYLSILLLFCACRIKAQDWPNLTRYQASNKILKDKGPAKVVYMGDSITDSWIDYSPDFFAQNGYIDRGISGQTTPQMVLRFRQDVIELKPKLVVILCGINDIAGNTGPSTLEMIENNIITMTELARANHIKVALCSLLPSKKVFWKPGLNPMDSIIALNKWIGNFARLKHFVFVDYYQALVDDQQDLKAIYSKDGLHPNKEGYKVMEQVVKARIKI